MIYFRGERGRRGGEEKGGEGEGKGNQNFEEKFGPGNALNNSQWNYLIRKTYSVL